MAKRKKSARLAQAEQSARFIETAKKAEVDETEEKFEQAFKSVVSPRNGKGKPSRSP